MPSERFEIFLPKWLTGALSVFVCLPASATTKYSNIEQGQRRHISAQDRKAQEKGHITSVVDNGQLREGGREREVERLGKREMRHLVRHSDRSLACLVRRR